MKRKWEVMLSATLNLVGSEWHEFLPRHRKSCFICSHSSADGAGVGCWRLRRSPLQNRTDTFTFTDTEHGVDMETCTALRQKRLNGGCTLKYVSLMEFMHLVFTCMPGKSSCRRLRSLLLYLCYIFQGLINSFVLTETSSRRASQY